MHTSIPTHYAYPHFIGTAARSRILSPLGRSVVTRTLEAELDQVAAGGITATTSANTSPMASMDDRSPTGALHSAAVLPQGPPLSEPSTSDAGDEVPATSRPSSAASSSQGTQSQRVVQRRKSLLGRSFQRVVTRLKSIRKQRSSGEHDPEGVADARDASGDGGGRRSGGGGTSDLAPSAQGMPVKPRLSLKIPQPPDVSVPDVGPPVIVPRHAPAPPPRVVLPDTSTGLHEDGSRGAKAGAVVGGAAAKATPAVAGDADAATTHAAHDHLHEERFGLRITPDASPPSTPTTPSTMATPERIGTDGSVMAAGDEQRSPWEHAAPGSVVRGGVGCCVVE